MANVQLAVAGDDTTQVILSVPGVQGPTGSSIPPSGTTHQLLYKQSSTDYDTGWKLITNDNVDASAAIAGTKISPDFGSQNAVTTGTNTAASFIPTSSSVPANGLYLPSANNVAISTNGTGKLFIDSAGKVTVKGVGTAAFVVEGTAPDNSLFIEGSTGNVGLGTSAPQGGLDIRAAGVTAPTVPSIVIGDDATTSNNSLPPIYFSHSGGRVRAAIQAVNESSYGGKGLWFQTFDPTAWTDGAASLQTRMVIDRIGRVGVGTTSPGVALHVDGDIRADGIYGETDTNTSIQFPGSDVITFNEGGSEAARIDSSGRLLVGTSSSESVGFAHLLQLEHGSGDRGISIIQNTNDAFASHIDFAKSRSTAAGGNTIVQNDDGLGSIIWRGADGSDKVTQAARIAAEVDGTPGADDMPGRLVFSVTADGASSPTEALRISNNRAITVSDGGNVVLGTTTGTKIGTTTTQKLGFYNATPVVQPAAVADATDAATVITQLNDLLAKLRTLGIIAT